jgi:TPR repeat protein
MARFDFSAADVADVAAPAGGADALFQLGLMYCAGRDVDVDLIEAHKWFNLAAMRGNDDAKVYRLELSREMSKQQISAAQKRAREWLKLH